MLENLHTVTSGDPKPAEKRSRVEQYESRFKYILSKDCFPRNKSVYETDLTKPNLL